MYKPILGYRDLVMVSVLDNGEPLSEVNKASPDVLCEYQKQDMMPYVGNRLFLRAGVIERLQRAVIVLKRERPNWRFKLVYAYRHPDVQKRYFDEQKRNIQLFNSSLAEEEIISRAHLLAASPDVAGHPTGGAVDITLINEKGEEVDMGTKIADFSQGKKILTFYPSLTLIERKNRLLLRELLMDQGFAPFDGEWWHFSYGDREWAKYYAKDAAFYDQKYIE